jgi:hypothetical protein
MAVAQSFNMAATSRTAIGDRLMPHETCAVSGYVMNSAAAKYSRQPMIRKSSTDWIMPFDP